MIAWKNYGPDGIERICYAAWRRAYRRLKREHLQPEARQFGILGDTIRRHLAALVVAQSAERLSALMQAPARRVVNDLATVALRRFLRAAGVKI